jgi:hypothetical protein
METKLLTEKYKDELQGVLNCYDRVIISGNLQPFCYAHGMTNYLYQQHIRIFDYARFAEPLTGDIQANAERIAQENGLKIEVIRKKNFRQEKRIRELLQQRGDQPGLVHIFSALESCPAYQPWHDKTTGKNLLKLATGRCLTYYFYFIDPEVGLCFLRVSTGCPFSVEFYFNGHAWLAAHLKERGIAFELRDKAFVNIADFATANHLAEHWNVEQLHAKLDECTQRYCLIVQTLQHRYQWSLRQVEYATDVVFKQSKSLAFYLPRLSLLVLCGKPDNLATFLGHKLHGNFQGEIGTRLNVRQWGTRIKHCMGSVSIKIYDKFGLIWRIETTVNQVSFFQQYREVHHRNGEREKCWAPMKKTIYSLAPLQAVLVAANRRYVALISEIETPEVGVSRLNQLTHRRVENQHSYKGVNFLAEEDAALARARLRGEFTLSGLTSKALRQLFPDQTRGHLRRALKRLRGHGLIKKVGHHYKDYLTNLGRQVAAMALKLREIAVLPMLARASTASL